MNHLLPNITILGGTLNSNLTIFKKVLESIAKQTYPRELIEHLIFDKGSTNGCVELAKKYNCNVISVQEKPGEEQVSAALGVKMAKGKYILMLESDNILTSRTWIEDLVEPIVKEKVFCSFSMHNTYYKNMSLTTRYAALFGSPDPTLYYLGKSEKVRMDQNKYDKGKIIKETPKYYVVQFNKDNLPTLGDNGHMFLKEAMIKTISDPRFYTHTDGFMMMLKNGHNTFGVVKNSMIHIMNPSIIGLVKRRIQIKEAFYDGWSRKRKYYVYNPKSSPDRIKLVKYMLFSTTFVEPFFQSIRGYSRINDTAWFLHPFLCFLMATGYGFSEVKKRFRILSIKLL